MNINGFLGNTNLFGSWREVAASFGSGFYLMLWKASLLLDDYNNLHVIKMDRHGYNIWGHDPCYLLIVTLLLH
uniref:Uncharacterized protein n=1 Tax=Arion vulgaris TaxID=1028688 RepID=A0A0B7BE47_9EUPU